MDDLLLCHTATPDEDGMRVRVLAVHALRLSKHQYARAKFQGCVTLDGAPAHADERVRAGQVLRVSVPEIERPATAPELDGAAPASESHGVPCALPDGLIVYQDDDVLVLNKPAPLATVRASKRDGHSLEDMLEGALGPDAVFRPVSRLDKGTSGLLVAARHAHAQGVLSRALHTEGYTRLYLAVLDGAPPAPEGACELPIAQDGSPKRFIDARLGRCARTLWRVLDQKNGRSLAAVRLQTGRTHQIRVHMAALGCPVAGDALYGQAMPDMQGRFALHSAFVAFEQPVTREALRFSAPCPKEWQTLFQMNFFISNLFI